MNRDLTLRIAAASARRVRALALPNGVAIAATAFSTARTAR